MRQNACSIVTHAAFAEKLSRLQQKKNINLLLKMKEIKCVKNAFVVDHCPSVSSVSNVLNAVTNKPVGGYLQNFGRFVKPSKMETPELRLSLQAGEWVTLLDFGYAYFNMMAQTDGSSQGHKDPPEQGQKNTDTRTPSSF